MIRYLAALIALFSIVTSPALAAERIHSFDVGIEVQTDGDILVTETIELTAEGNQIRRGIFRDLPRYYEGPKGYKYSYGYDVESVRRNGEKEPYDKTTEGNAWRLIIGDEDVILPTGKRQTYEIVYRVKNEIRYFDDHDELYWNVTGNYWAFPIDAASALIELPEGAQVQDISVYSGRYGEAGSNARASQNGNEIRVATTEPLGQGGGLSVSVSLAKGVIEPPTLSDKLGLFWQRNLGMAALLVSLLGVFLFLYRSWKKVGVDAPRLPVHPIYHPTKAYSPAAAHHVYYRKFEKDDAFSATLIDLSIKGYLELETEKKAVTLTRKTPENPPPITQHQRKLLDSLFASSSVRKLGGKYDSSFASTYKTFKSDVAKQYGKDYFRWNAGYVLFAVAVSILAFVIAAATTLNWSIWHGVMIVGLIVMNVAFMYFMPAQTKKGEKARAEIAGLRLYMETAEKHQMNDVDVHGERLPPMSKDRYEELLPYAMALNVEKPWSKYFEKVLPDEAKSYEPGWAHGYWAASSLHGMSESIGSSISSGVSTASVNPSSSSGSGGGGFSGGGGGGGGGGGW